MKYAVSIYSFDPYIKKGLLTPVQCVQRAKEMGFDAIEIVDFALTGEAGPKAAAEILAAEAKRLDMEISNYAVGADLINGSNGDLDKEIERLQAQVDIAKVLGCPTMRHDVARGTTPHIWQGYDSVLDRLVKGCRAVTAYAERLGIKTMTENHGYFSQDSLRVEKLINTVASDNFGWLIDMGNFLFADDEPAAAVGRAARYGFYVHAKDFIVKSGNEPDPGRGVAVSRGGQYLRPTIIGQGNVPVVQCLRGLKKANFDGYIAIEFEGMEDCIDGISIGFENLKRYVNMVF